MAFQSLLTPLPHQPLWATILSCLDYWNSILNGLASILLPCDLVSKQWSASSSYLFIFNIYLFIWLCHIFLVACRIFYLSCGMWDLVLWPGIKPGPLALGVQSLGHWTLGKPQLLNWVSHIVPFLCSVIHLTQSKSQSPHHDLQDPT